MTQEISSTQIGRTPHGLGRALGGQNLSLIVALCILVVVIGANNDKFFMPVNLLNIGLAVALLGLVAMPQTVAVISGGLDVSVGAIVGLGSVITAMVLANGQPLAVGIASGLMTGLIAGSANGLFVAYGRINPIIATLATFTAYQGLTLIVINGRAIAVQNPDLLGLGTGRIAGVPIPFIVLLAVVAIFFFVLRYTDVGRNVFAIGGNAEAARIAGINLGRYRFGIYAISGLVAGLAGVLLTAKTGAGLAESGAENLSLESITAVLLGGAALTGGRGSVLSSILGVALLGVLANGLVLLNVPAFYQLVARGGLLLFAVLIQEWRGTHIKMPKFDSTRPKTSSESHPGDQPSEGSR